MARLLASWFGTGLILGRVRGEHGGSGTVGALFAFPVALLVGVWGGWQAQLIASAVVVGLSLWSTGLLAREEGDAGWIVIDEAAGVFVATIGLTLWPGAVVAFVVFRVVDIFKRLFPGVASAERLSGGVGITGDDLVAGIYGLVVGHIVQSI
jgi:phosphatidylglycerophosphatase A